MNQYSITPYFPNDLKNHAPWVAQYGLHAPYGKCQCGCGEVAPISRWATKSKGLGKGQPYRFIKGHGKRSPYRNLVLNPSGLCECGCGRLTPIAQKMDIKRGYVVGQHVRYILGHQKRKANASTEEGYPLWVARHGLRFPYGQCQCGCGQNVGIASHTSVARGLLKGEPVQYIVGHLARTRPSISMPRMYGRNHPNWKERLKFVCKFCNNEFERVPWETRGKDNTNEYCSAKCRDNYRKQFWTGENSPLYVGGITTYRGKGWLVARKKIVERQNGYCHHCGKYVGDSLPVHHIRPFREFSSVEQANDLSNLLGLCQSCHMKMEPRPRKARKG